MKKISVLVPMYNCEKYIDNTINSILVQKYDNLEIILIDDGSTDNTRKIVQKYLSNENVKMICQTNLGAPSARNNGILNSSGDYALFLDSDDILCDDALEGLNDYLEDEVDLLIGNFNKIDENGKILCNCRIVSNNHKINKENILNYAMLDPKPGCKIYNLNTIKNNKLFFDDVKIGQDLNFYLKYLIVANNIQFVDKNIYNYRIVNNSISRTYSLKILDICESFEYVRKFYDSKGKLNEYNKYIVWSEYFNIYFQYCKLRYFKNKSDRKKIYQIFNERRKSLIVDKKCYIFKKYKKLYFISKIRFNLGWLYKSDLYYKIFTKIKGSSHI